MLSKLIGNALLLPSPFAVIKALLELLQSNSFWINVAQSFYRIALGFILGSILGVLLAVSSYWNKLLYALFHPFINIIKATPIASITILLLVWISSKNLSIILVTLVVLPNIYNNVLEGLYQTDQKLLEMALVFQMTRMKKIRYIYLPKVMEFFLPALSYSLGFSWKAGISGEVLAQPVNSIGEALYYSKIYLETSSLFAYTLFVIGISMVMEKVFIYLIKNMFQRSHP